MSEEQKPKKIELNEVMLAMDVVDTLRHQQSLVERELGADDHDQALIARVRKIYADQGLEVSDDNIASGVKALREERFTYTPPKKSFQLTLAHLYVNRGRWAKRGALLLAALVVVYFAYHFAVVAPQKRSRQKAAQAINLRIDRQQDQISVAKARMARLNQSVTETKQAGTYKATAAARGLVDQATRDISAAQEKVQALEKLEIKTHIDRGAMEIGQSLPSSRKLAEMLGVKLHEVPVGFKYIGALMESEPIIVGGEESGGLSVKGHVPEKDGILACLLMAELVATERKSLGQILKELAKQTGEFHTERINIPIQSARKDAIMAKLSAGLENIGEFKVEKFITTDGFKFLLPNHEWVAFRASGTEPLFRCYIEAKSEPHLKRLRGACRALLAG